MNFFVGRIISLKNFFEKINFFFGFKEFVN